MVPAAKAPKYLMKAGKSALRAGQASKGASTFTDAVTAAKNGSGLMDRGASVASKAQAGAKPAAIGASEKAVAKDIDLRVKPKHEFTTEDLAGMGPYKKVGGHHPLAQQGFKGNLNYSSREALSISNELMEINGIDHVKVTGAQRRLFMELGKSGAPNTMKAHTDINLQALIEGGASESLARAIMARSLNDARNQGVRYPTNIPWYTAITKSKGD